ncbi:MAG: hypothetical protein ABH877_04685 [bacterium]
MGRVTKMFAITLMVVALIATAGLLASGCGGPDQEQAKADLGVSILELETAVAGLKGVAETMTVGDLKKTQPLAELVNKMIQAGKNVSGADVTAFETGWNALQAAVFALPDDMSVIDAIKQLMPAALAVLASGEALKGFAAPPP